MAMHYTAAELRQHNTMQNANCGRHTKNVFYSENNYSISTKTPAVTLLLVYVCREDQLNGKQSGFSVHSELS